MLIRIIIFYFAFSGISFGQTKTKLKGLLHLIDSRYQFYGHKNGNFYQIGDGWIKKVAEDEIYTYEFTQKDKKRDRKKLLAALYSIVKKEHDLYFSKGEEVFLLRNKRVIQIYPLKSPELEWLKKQKTLITREKDFQKKIDNSLCGFCQFSLSGNYVNIDRENPQASPELSWIPHLALSNALSLNTPIGFSTYLIEDDDLNEIVDIALKAQISLRYKFQYFFVEAGSGIHKFFTTETTSSISSFTLGRFFQGDIYVFSKLFSLNYIYAQYSQVSWDKTLDEIKFGIGVSI